MKYMKILSIRNLFLQFKESKRFAAMKFQSIVRMFFRGKLIAKKEWEHIRATRILQTRKIIFIQRCYRGFLARKRVLILNQKRDYIRNK